MIIAFDLRRIASAGVGRYMRGMVRSIILEGPQHEYVFIMAPGTEDELRDCARAKIVIANAPYYSIAEQVELPRVVRECRADVLHAMHFVVPLVRPCPTVVTIHDTIHLVFPQDLTSWMARLYARWMMRAAARVADRIITVSEYSKRDICQYLKVNPEKIDVSYPGVDACFSAATDPQSAQRTKSELGVQEDYILYTGIYRERKNHSGLLKAFAQLRARGVHISLVIAGALGNGEKVLRDLARGLGVERFVVFAGFVPDEKLPALYSSASAYVCPSLYEGFGQTVVEAMVCGTPVVSHNETSLPEICGDAAICVNARDPDELAGAIRRVLEDKELRCSLVQRGYRNVERFSFATAARQTLQIYEAVLEKTKCR